MRNEAPNKVLLLARWSVELCADVPTARILTHPSRDDWQPHVAAAEHELNAAAQVRFDARLEVQRAATHGNVEDITRMGCEAVARLKQKTGSAGELRAGVSPAIGTVGAARRESLSGTLVAHATDTRSLGNTTQVLFSRRVKFHSWAERAV